MTYWKFNTVPFKPVVAVIGDDFYSHHRGWGVIPGCVPAVDVFIERTTEQVHLFLHASAARYCHDMKTLPHQEFINKPLEGHLPAFR